MEQECMGDLDVEKSKRLHGESFMEEGYPCT